MGERGDRAVTDAFAGSDSISDDYGTQGFTVLRGILPPARVEELRVAADRLRHLARRDRGPQAQRTDALVTYDDQADLAPFERYLEVEEIQAAFTRLLGPGHTCGGLDGTTLLIEPRDGPWQLGWHRDWVAEAPAGARDDRFWSYLIEHWHDPLHFHQVNAALYPDSCTWYVPGSHLRFEDLDGESESLGSPELRPRTPGTGRDPTEADLLDHCRAMPGAVQVELEPGDLLVYNQLGWHNGNYTPARPRATIHHIIRHWTFETFVTKWRRKRNAAVRRHRWRRLRRRLTTMPGSPSRSNPRTSNENTE